MNFNEIPANNLVPMFFTEFDNSNAVKAGAMPWKNLLIGQPLAANATYNGKLVQVTSDEQAEAYFGEGSQLALMCKAFRKNSKTSELWCLPVISASGAAATGKIAVAVAGSNGLVYGGNVCLMIGGQHLDVPVAALDKAADIAKKIADAINAVRNLPVTAENSSADVNIAAKNKGVVGNGISIEVNFYQGEELPDGLTLTVTKMASGNGDPVYNDTNVGNIISGVWFNAVASASHSTANITYLKELMDERWLATDQRTGVVIYTVDGEKAAYITEGEGRNSQVLCIPSLPNTPTPNFEVAAATLGVIAPIAQNDPAAPLSNYEVKGIVAPRPEKQLGLSEQNDLLKAGCALLVASVDGAVYLKRMVTTYKRTANGAADTSYQQIETVFTLSFIRWDWNNYMASRYPHAKLADDGNDFGPGQVVMTPKLGMGELLGRYEYWMGKGIVQNYDEFKKNLVVMRDPDDKTAMQFLIPAELISQFFVGKSKVLFK